MLAMSAFFPLGVKMEEKKGADMLNVLDVCDIKKALEGIKEEIKWLREGRILIDTVWLYFKNFDSKFVQGKEKIMGTLEAASYIADEELEKLRKAKEEFEEELKKRKQ